MSNCKVCGIELTPDNAYSRIKEAFIPLSYCIDCHKERERIKYRKNPSKKIKSVLKNYEKKKKFTLKMRRGRISFNSYLEKHSFITGLRLQARFGRGHISPSSNFGKSVCIRSVERVQQNGKTITKKRFVPLRCDDPTCNGVIRTLENGFDRCQDCGLLVDDRLPIHRIYDFPTYDSVNWATRLKYIPLPPDESKGDIDENGKCFDRYYAQAYSKRLR